MVVLGNILCKEQSREGSVWPHGLWGERAGRGFCENQEGAGSQGVGGDTPSRRCLQQFESHVARATGNSENTAGPVLLGTWTQNYSTEFSPMKYQVTVTEMVAPDPQRGGEPCATGQWPGRPACSRVAVPSGRVPLCASGFLLLKGDRNHSTSLVGCV